MYASASIRINQHQSASININQNQSASISINQNQSASIRINQHQSASIRINQHQSTSINICQHQSAPTSINQHQTMYTGKNAQNLNGSSENWKSELKLGHNHVSIELLSELTSINQFCFWNRLCTENLSTDSGLHCLRLMFVEARHGFHL